MPRTVSTAAVSANSFTMTSNCTRWVGNPRWGLDASTAMMGELYSAFDGFEAALEDQSRPTIGSCVDGCRRVSLPESSTIPATGMRTELAGVSLWEFDNGKACHHWIFPDGAALISQLR
jgi:hypothetical protein